MKIAILTLRVDNNYGGHLQRYALMQVLKEMGHEPVVLFFRSTWVHDSPIVRFKKATKNLIKALIGRKHNPVMYWKHEDYRWEELRAFTFPFFEKNVVHSPLICSEQDLQKFVDSEKFDGFVVGSDQVWRKAYTQRWGVDHFFLDFAPKGTKRIAYAASFGLPDMEYDDDEIKRLDLPIKEFMESTYKLTEKKSIKKQEIDLFIKNFAIQYATKASSNIIHIGLAQITMKTIEDTLNKIFRCLVNCSRPNKKGMVEMHRVELLWKKREYYNSKDLNSSIFMLHEFLDTNVDVIEVENEENLE